MDTTQEWENGKSKCISLSLPTHTTITFLSPLGIPPFSHFYLQSQPRRLQMWRNVTQCDRWVRLRLLLPVCPRFCHTFFFFWHSERKTMSSRVARLHPKASPTKKKKILDSSTIRKVFLSTVRLSVIYDDQQHKSLYTQR